MCTPYGNAFRPLLFCLSHIGSFVIFFFFLKISLFFLQMSNREQMQIYMYIHKLIMYTYGKRGKMVIWIVNSVTSAWLFAAITWTNAILQFL